MAEIRTTSMPNYKRKKFLTRDQASMSFSKRTKTLKKKAHEIQTLCDVRVCMVCFGPDSTVQTWPEGAVEVKDSIMSYKGICYRKKYESSLTGYLQDKKMKLELKKQKEMKKVNKERMAKWSDHVNGLSDDALRDTIEILESKLFDLKEKVKLSMQRSKVKAIQDNFDIELEMDGSSVPSRAAGATESPAEVMDTNIDVVETAGNNDKAAACSSFEMPPPLPKDSSDWMENFRNWMENDEAYQHGFENDDWFNELESKQQYDDRQLW
uniref:MADS-box domain-containing protein n=1 Tax=Salix viminalis TaxID=40686 RepID=A0A6N2K6V9_SALVM